MMKSIAALLYFALLVLQGVTSDAQAYSKTVLHAGTSLSNINAYLFPSFEHAEVKFRDGRSFAYRMNFNTLLCDMQYIDKNGDTLAITNAVEIDSIRFDSSLFIYDHQKGYFQIVAASDAGGLAIYRRTTFEPVQIGGMGEERQSGGVEMINLLNSRQGPIPMVLNQDIYVVKKTSYLLIYKSGEMEKAGKAAFLKIYTGDKESFEQYIKANRINFNEQGDLEKIFHFCTPSKM